MILVDTRSTFLDTEGKPLSAGRLLFYKADNTTELVGYTDEAFTTPIGTSVRLMDAGWLQHEVYFTETACVHVQKFVGVDAQNNDLFSDEKVITVPPSVTASCTSSGSYMEVDSIAELQEVIPSDGMLVFVKGYYEKGDAPIRAAYFDINSFVQSNSGTVIESNQAPQGRWIIPIEGPYADSRIFGVIPSATQYVVNSYIARFENYCTANKKIAYFTTGNYFLQAGGNLMFSCNFKADSGVVINSSSGEYTLYIINDFGSVDIADTLAGENVILHVCNTRSVIPDTAWGLTLTNLPEYFGDYIGLKLTKSQTINLNSNAFYDIYLSSGISTFVGRATADRFIKNYTDAGRMIFVQSGGVATIQAPELKASMLVHDSTAASQSSMNSVLEQFRGRFIVDEAITDEIVNGSTDAFHVIACKMYIKEELALGPLWEMPYVEFIAYGKLRNHCRFFRDIEVEWFSDANYAIQSYAYSYTVQTLDLKGRTTRSTVEKYTRSDNNGLGTNMNIHIKNGQIRHVSNPGFAVILENVTVFMDNTSSSRPCVTAAELRAKDCVFKRISECRMFGASNLYFDNCSFGKTDESVVGSVYMEYPLSLEMYNCKCEAGNKTLYIRTSGYCTIVNSHVGNVLVVPKSSAVEDIKILNSTLYSINFSASSTGAVGGAVCKNIHIEGNRMEMSSSVNDPIKVTNGSTIRWAINGHAGIVITNNLNSVYGIPCRSTEDSMRVKATSYTGAGAAAYRNYYLDTAKYLFIFDTTDNEVPEFSEGAPLYIRYVSAIHVATSHKGETYNIWCFPRVLTNNQIILRCGTSPVVGEDQWYVTWKIYP